MADTKQRILDAARELFAAQGVQKTSLREIADRLGISKPALYYHFSSREDLVRTIVAPVIDGGEEFIRNLEQRPDIDRRTVLEEYFDLHYQHRGDIRLLLQEINTLSDLGLIDMVVAWRHRIGVLLLGPEPSLGQLVRATMALGGIQDCTIQFTDVPQDELRKLAVEAACELLGFEKTPPGENRSGSPVV